MKFASSTLFAFALIGAIHAEAFAQYDYGVISGMQRRMQESSDRIDTGTSTPELDGIISTSRMTRGLISPPATFTAPRPQPQRVQWANPYPPMRAPYSFHPQDHYPPRHLNSYSLPYYQYGWR